MESGGHTRVHGWLVCCCVFYLFINPRRACAARVTVLGLCVCVSVTTFSAATRNETAKKRYQRVQYHTGFIFKNGDFGKNAAFESYGVKQSEGANMQIGTQGEYRLPRAI